MGPVTGSGEGAGGSAGGGGLQHVMSGLRNKPGGGSGEGNASGKAPGNGGGSQWPDALKQLQAPMCGGKGELSALLQGPLSAGQGGLPAMPALPTSAMSLKEVEQGLNQVCMSDSANVKSTGKAGAAPGNGAGGGRGRG